jgi:hypothetical protein
VASDRAIPHASEERDVEGFSESAEDVDDVEARVGSMKGLEEHALRPRGESVGVFDGAIVHSAFRGGLIVVRRI